MSFYIQKLLLHNRAPFENIELDFSEGGIMVLSAINGGGKTTIISHIVDAWHELAKKAFYYEYQGKENKFYRISSSMFALGGSPSMFYIRFSHNGTNYDYVDLRNNCTKDEYDKILIHFDNHINFSVIENQIKESNFTKYSNLSDVKIIRKIFENNLVTSFPSYRYEKPGYLNSAYDVNFDYSIRELFSGYLDNPIEINCNSSKLFNWLMDLVLDTQIFKTDVKSANCLANLNCIFRNLLKFKINKDLRLGIGIRYISSQRISIVEQNENGGYKSTIYPSVLNMSSGELAIINIFGELVRQFDNINQGAYLKQAEGVV